MEDPVSVRTKVRKAELCVDILRPDGSIVGNEVDEVTAFEV
jgi:hypothetical protein